MAEDKKAAGGGGKGGKRGLLIGLAAALLSGAAGFSLVFFDILPLPVPPRTEVMPAPKRVEQKSAPLTAFVPLTPLIVTLGEGDALRQLQMTAQLEVAPEAVETVSLLTPRVVDVLNTYLRAVDSSTVEDPTAMLRMRAQMLRRVQVVTGEGMVRDLLVAEFILR